MNTTTKHPTQYATEPERNAAYEQASHYKAYAQRLAEALANLARPLTNGWKVSDMDVRIKEANEALSAWEGAQQ